MLKTYLLVQLAALAEHGTLSEASRKLHLSQPAISRSMHKLEEILGISLFERTKNHITMNETGKLAAEYAKRILREEQDMVERIRAFDRSQHTISFGSCAPVPLNAILSLLPKYFPDMAVSSELNSDAPLLRGLKNDFFHLVILHQEPEDSELYAKKCGRERLFLSLPPAHPLATSQGIYLKEMDGEHILLYAKLGFWYDLSVEKMPHAKFLMQHERQVFTELVNVSAFPSFTTDVFIRQGYAREHRVAVPILDEEADVTYYCVCKEGERKRFQRFFEDLPEDGIDWSAFSYVM